MVPRNRPHIFVTAPPIRERYARPPRRIKARRPPTPIDPRAHAEALAEALKEVNAEALQRRGTVGVSVPGAVPGILVQFDSHVDMDLELDSLENRQQHIELVAVQEDGQVRRATVFVPDDAVKHFLKTFDKYIHQTTAKGERRHRDLVESIAALRTATLRALWTDDPSAYPSASTPIWWEVWLRRSDGSEALRLERFASLAGMRMGRQRLGFVDRVVALVHGTAEQLSASLDVLGDIAEVRLAKQLPADFAAMPAEEQGDWVREFLDRLSVAGEKAPSVCILDTGVNRGHPLLRGSLSSNDMHAVDPRWGTDDHDSHGTEMAGLALLGELTPLLMRRDQVHLRHRLESVKILPPPGAGANERDLWGAVVAHAANVVEIAAPHRPRVFSLAVAASDTRDRGQPTSWSAALDALAAGRSFNATTAGLEYIGAPDSHRRLFVVCAGNVRGLMDPDHLARSDAEPVHDPGQAWNALTVGAHTELGQVDSATARPGWSPLAAVGELSPYSCTSVGFQRVWPIKPDVVFEGGNALISADGRNVDVPIDELSPITTFFKPAERLLAATCATSAATAQVARIAGEVAATFPGMWPETTRALVVHSAEWTPQMRQRLQSAKNKTQVDALLRRYGFGVPSVERALRSANNALTLVTQETIRPFAGGKIKEWNIHDLPWPKDVLSSMFDAEVRLRVTLSYFVEPNPARRGWKTRHRYASFGLRFDVKLPGESDEDFRRRLNQNAVEDGERGGGGSDSSEWLLGFTARHRGSLHADVWTGTAAQLAERGRVGVYPVSGWWKELKALDRSEFGVRYALIVSIETERTDVDIWTPVAQMVEVPTAIVV
jgi:hypothetical protein